MNKADFDAALTIGDTLLKIFLEQFCERHMFTAELRNLQGTVLKMQYKHEESLPMFVSALVTMRLCDADHSAIASVKLNLSDVYRERCDFKRALKLLREVEEGDERIYGREHPSTAWTYGRIAHVLQETGDNKEAILYFKREHSINERVLGSDALATAQSLVDIGFLYASEEKWSKSIQIIEKGLPILEKKLGNNHVMLAKTYGNLAEVYRLSGNFKKAVAYKQKDVKIKTRVLGPTHEETLRWKLDLETFRNKNHYFASNILPRLHKIACEQEQQYKDWCTQKSLYKKDRP